MPFSKIRLSATAVVLLSGCATFTASQSNKPNTEQAAPSGPRPSSYTSSWSGNQNAKRAAQDGQAPAGAGVAAGDSERRIQDLLASGERSQSAGDRRSARTAYEQALRLAPGDAAANYQLAIMDDEEGRFAEAEAHYFNVLRQTPNDPNVLSSLGWSYFLQGRYDDSDRILREALRYDPNNKFALNNLGMLYGTRGDYDGALTIFRMAGSEADAQKALALLKQNAGAVPVAGEQYVNTPVNPAIQAGGAVAGNNADPPAGKGAAELEYATPQARKFAEDYKRLKAENDRQQQEKRAKLAQKNMSAPSPWNNNRQTDANSGQRDAGRANDVQGSFQGENPVPSGLPAFRGNPAAPSQLNGRFPANDAAYPGAAPSQANRPRQADPADFGPVGNATGSPGGIPPFKPRAQSFPGTQAIYEQPAAPRSDGQTRSPVITPSREAPTSRDNSLPTWNSLPRDDSYRGGSNGGYTPAQPGRLSDWPANRPGNSPANNPASPGAADRSAPESAGQFNGAQQQGGGHAQQDAQAAAAQVGLSAGAGALGFPASDWPSAQNGQTANPGNGSGPPSNGNFPDGQIPPSNQNPFSGQNSGLPPWPGRTLSSGSVPQAVVPSAQGVVYGSTGDSGLPNFYSGRPTVSPAR